MDTQFEWIDETMTSQKYRTLIGRLESARNKLTPIVDDIVVSAIDLIQTDDERIVSECSLTAEQYQNVVWASQLLKEIELEYLMEDTKYSFPNTNVIVNNVSVGSRSKMMLVKDKTIIIDEANVVELLELYEQMGVVIQRIISKGTRVSDERMPKSMERILSSNKDMIDVVSEETDEPAPETTTESDKSFIRNQSAMSAGRVETPETSSIDAEENFMPSRSASRISAAQPFEAASRSQLPSQSNLRSRSASRISTAQPSEAASRSQLPSQANLRSRSASRRQMSSAAPSTMDLTSKSASKTEMESDAHLTPPQIKSTISAMINSSSRNLNKQPSQVTPARSTEQIKHFDDEANIYIRIQCFSDLSDDEEKHDDREGDIIPCTKDCPSRYHVKLGGEPVTLKVNKNAPEDGAVYCIGAGSEDANDIKIIIKRCPECRSTIIGSSSRIHDMVGESHESITLHGKGADEANLSYSSEELEATVPGRDSRSEEEVYKQTSPPKIDVLLDAENVDQSTVQFKGSPQPSAHDIRESPVPSSMHQTPKASESRVIPGSPERSESRVIPGSPERSESRVIPGSPERSESQVRGTPKASESQISGGTPKRSESRISDKVPSRKSGVLVKPSSVRIQEPIRETGIPLTRTRICSSMEFDVKTVHTKLRDHGIQHGNARIVVELKELGVDQILRACRPAKCCRKAILNEKQRTALPYCVSLKSLPLMGNDAEVIKQSIEMSVRKIKNSLDLTQAYKDKLAYYVSLGRDDFRPNINFPWVIPIYDVMLNHNVDNVNNDKKFYVLKKQETGERSGYEKKLKGILKNRPSRTKCFVLKKTRPLRVFSSSSTIITRRMVKRMREYQRTTIKLRNKQEVFHNGNDHLKISTCKRVRYKKKNICSSIGNCDWHIAFAREHHIPHSQNVINLDQRQSKKLTKLTKVSLSKKHLRDSVNTKNFKNVFESGDCSSSLSKLLGSYLRKRKCDDNQVDACLGSMSNTNEDIKEMCHQNTSCRLSLEEMENKKSLNTPKSMPALWNQISEELFYTSKALTLFVKRRRSLRQRKLPAVEENYFHNVLEKPKKAKKKLEYYVGLLNGNLVWSQTLPLVPQNYNTYYNHSTENPPPTNTPVEEEPMTQVRVTNQKGQRVYSRVPSSELEPPVPSHSNSANASRRSTISEILPEHMAELESSRPPRNDADSSKSVFKPFSMGPETTTAPWVPFVVSDISLPQIHEEIQKEETIPLEAIPSPPPPPPPGEKPKSKCEKTDVCNRNSCVDCKEKPCEKPKTCESKAICVQKSCVDCSTVVSKSSKKCKGGDIRIAIRKAKGRSICVEGKAPKACNKEICEIYKNKLLVPDKSTNSSQQGEQKFKFRAKDNIEIYINNQKISLTKGKCKKSKEPKDKSNKKEEDETEKKK